MNYSIPASMQFSLIYTAFELMEFPFVVVLKIQKD